MPVPPYTICYQPNSSGTVLAGQHPSSTHSGTSGVHVGSYDPVLSTFQSLGGPDKISSQMGITNTPCFNSTSILGTCPMKSVLPRISSTHMSHHRYLTWEVLRSHPPWHDSSTRINVESYLVDTTLTTHPRHTPRSPQVVNILAVHSHSQTSLYSVSHHRYNAK